MFTDNWIENELDFSGLANISETINKVVSDALQNVVITKPNASTIRIGNTNKDIDKIINNAISNIKDNMASWETHSWNSGRSSFDTWASKNSSWESQNWNHFYGLGGNPRVRTSVRSIEQTTFKYSVSYFIHHTDDNDNRLFAKMFDTYKTAFEKAVSKHEGWELSISEYDGEYDIKKNIVTVKGSLVVKYDDSNKREAIIKSVKDFFYAISENISFVSANWTNWLKVNDNGKWKEIYTLSNDIYNLSVETSIPIENLWLIAFSDWLSKREFTKYVKVFFNGTGNTFTLEMEIIKPFIDEDEIAYILFKSPIGNHITEIDIQSNNKGTIKDYRICPENIICKEYFEKQRIDFTTTESPVAKSNRPTKVIDETKKRYRKCVYEIVKQIDDIDGIPVKAYIVKKHRGKLDGKRYTLNQHDCELLGIEYRANLEILPYDMEFGDVYKKIKNDED